MQKINLRIIGAAICSALIFLSCQKDSVSRNKDISALKTIQANINGKGTTMPVVKVFATGLNNPRGLKFGPDGYLYVAEAGVGGINSSVGMCEQVPFPVGPYTGSTTGARISKINRAGTRTTFADNFPSSQANELIGGDVEGVADLSFSGHVLYAILAGAGCSHGVPSIPNAVVKVKQDGSWSIIANLSSWLMAHPAAVINPGDFEPDGTPYSMITVHDDFFIIEPNHGQFLKVTRKGDITRVADISASQGHIVPTVVTFDENFYIGNLNTFPIVDGSSKILKVTPNGNVSVWATGFTTILGIVTDHKDNMYVLENTTGAPFPTPGKGNIIRINKAGERQIIASGLNLPTGITLGPDGNLYVSNVGFGPAARGGGQVLRVEINERDHDGDEHD